VGWLIASIVTTFVTYALRAVRWQLLLKPLKHIHLDGLLSATLLGFSAIYLLGRPAELVRPAWVSRRERVPFGASLSIIVVERLLDFMILVLFFGLTLAVIELPLSVQAGGPLGLMKSTAWLMLAGSSGAIIALFFFRSQVDRITAFVPFKRVASMLHNFAQGLAFLGSAGSFGVVLGHTVVIWVLIALQFWFMMLGMQFHFSVAAATLVMVFVAIGSTAQIPGIGGGFQAGFVFCLGTFFSIPAEKAIAASLIAWLVTYAPTVGVAALYMLFTGLSLKDLRGMEPS
jgi:uncharacterized membrane protein YbhN (UPF0104 family)